MNPTAQKERDISRSPKKSVVTCDLEGRIATFGKDASEIFGYEAAEVVGKKRVSLFSPGLVVLQNVPGWLKTAREEGAYEGRTVFVRKNGEKFAADIRITPTKQRGEHIGYCGVTTPREEVPIAEAMPKIGVGTRIFAALVVTRAPFLTATVIPVLAAAAGVAFHRGSAEVPLGLLGLVVAAAVAMHVAANTFNDYFDTKSGADEANNDYFLPFSGGSRAVELGLISLRGLATVATVALALACAIGLYLAAISSWHVLLVGLIGAFSAFFYTAPPLYLAARRGLGELFVGLNFGPLMVLGTATVLGGGFAPDALADAIWLGIPIGLLTTAILFINEIPDEKGDRTAGKRNLVVVLGTRAARWPFVAILIAAFAVPALGIATGALPMQALVVFLAAPLALRAGLIAVRHYGDRSLIRANRATILLQLVAGMLLCAGLVWAAA